MTALTEDKITTSASVETLFLKVAAGAKFFKGGTVAIQTDGFAAPAANVAGHVTMGSADRGIDNTNGLDGAVEVETQPNNLLRNFVFAAVSPDQSWVGKQAFIVDDQTVAIVDPGNAVRAGTVIEIRDTDTDGSVLVDVLRKTGPGS